MQWLEICLSFGSLCFPIFIENAVHGCSKSELGVGDMTKILYYDMTHFISR